MDLLEQKNSPNHCQVSHPGGEANGQKPDRKSKLRKTVDLILPESLMIFLAFLLVPVVLIQWFVNDLSPGWILFLDYINYAIWGVFVLEYVSKAVLAPNILRHVLNPWHLLDLFVCVVPLIDIFQISIIGVGRSSPLLRLLRIIRVFAAGGRAVDRRIKQRASVSAFTAEQAPLEVRVVDGNLENVQTGVSITGIKEYLSNSQKSWIDITSVSEADIAGLSQVLNIPQAVLESGLIEESYPHIDYFGHFSSIFVRTADVFTLETGSKRLIVERSGLLVICAGQNIITISNRKTSVFNEILEKTRRHLIPQDSLVVMVLYSVIKISLERVKRIIMETEKELMYLENIPFKERPPDFLEATFHLKKEISQVVPSLLHMKEIAMVITSKRVPLEGFNEKHQDLFEIMADEAAYLHETAEAARDNLLSLIDLYINTTSFELNRVMRIIAVITCLGIIPALCGMFGSNIAGNPWDIQLWQLFCFMGFLMLAMGWIFYRLGWLKW
jgi:Mg2+ and Co2+ transporter CorA